MTASSLEVIAASGWFAERQTRTEDLYKIYAKSFPASAEYLRCIRQKLRRDRK
jgi:phosphoglucomutase